jgi:hypothetical protein
MSRLFGLASLIGQMYDGLLVATAATPLLPQIDSTAKAGRLIITIGVTIFLAGAGTSMAVGGYLGLPARVSAMERMMYLMAQDLCVIRAATEQLDAVQCLRSLDR